MSDPVICLNRVTKTYQAGEIAVQALRGVTLQVEAGEFLAIVGPSGSGKTTLLDILGCLSRPTTGDYLLNGIAVGSASGGVSDQELARIRNARIGFVFQTFHLLPRYTALENVELPLFYSGLSLSRCERKKGALEALRAVGLEKRIHHWPGQLSGGEQQRVAIARAMVNKPSLLLADEPTGNLDSQAGRDVIELLAHLAQGGTTVLLVTHNTEMAASAARIITLRDGVMVNGDHS